MVKDKEKPCSYRLARWVSRRNPFHSRCRNSKGFTLIELLVVIAVIGILAAIAVPSYVRYKRLAVDDHMISDLKNATVAMESYYADNKVYTSSVASLLAVGLSLSSGVTLSITLVPPDSYTMTASKPNGTKPSYSYDSTTGLIQ